MQPDACSSPSKPFRPQREITRSMRSKIRGDDNSSLLAEFRAGGLAPAGPTLPTAVGLPPVGGLAPANPALPTAVGLPLVVGLTDERPRNGMARCEQEG